MALSIEAVVGLPARVGRCPMRVRFALVLYERCAAFLGLEGQFAAWPTVLDRPRQTPQGPCECDIFCEMPIKDSSRTPERL